MVPGAAAPLGAAVSGYCGCDLGEVKGAVAVVGTCKEGVEIVV